MNKKIIIISSIIFVAAASTTATLLTVNKPQEVAKVTTSKAPETPVKVEAANIPTPAPEAPQSAPTPAVDAQPTVPSNEDLIVQYGWTQDPFMTAISGIMQMVPQYFTDNERVAAFAYLNDVCSKLGPNISYCSNAMITRGNDKALTWLNLGKAAGVDVSRYE